MSVQAMPAATPARTIRSLPGPRGWPLLGVASQIKPTSFHQQLEDWAGKYGDVFTFRIGGRRFLAISDPEVMATVLRSRPALFRRSVRLEQVSREMGFLGLFAANGEDWKRQRPMVLSGLDPAHLRTYLPSIVEVTERLRRRWQAAAGAEREIDLLPELMRYTVDVTTCLAFGKNLNTLETSEDAAIQQHLNVILPALFGRVLSPFDLRRWFPDKALVGHVRALQEAVQGFIADTRRELAAEPALREQPRNLIQALVAAREAGALGLSDEDVAGNVLTMLLAGEDTTANTLAWMIWLLYRNPQAAQAARREADAVLGAGGVVRSIEQLARLDEVEGCANEAMRLKPVAPVILNTALQEVQVGDVLVPKGAIVICMLRPPGMDPAHFSEPARFEPARWRSGAADGVPSLTSAKRVVMPFGAGPRMCPGRYLAMAEIKMVAAMLLANFELDEVATPGRSEPAERMALTMAPVGLRMRLRSRYAAAQKPAVSPP